MARGAVLKSSQEERRFVERFWRIQRAAWVGLALLLVLALAGAMGDGPLARARRRSPDGSLTVQYDRIAHLDGSARLRIAAASRGRETVLGLGGGFWKGAVLETLSPAPLRTVSGTAGYDMVFATVPGDSLVVHLSYRPTRLGRLPIHLEAAGAMVTPGVLVLP